MPFSGNLPNRFVSRLKNLLASKFPIKKALASRSVTRHQSATVIPKVNSDSVSISTLIFLPENIVGSIKYAVTHGSCKGARLNHIFLYQIFQRNLSFQQLRLQQSFQLPESFIPLSCYKSFVRHI